MGQDPAHKMIGPRAWGRVSALGPYPEGIAQKHTDKR